MFFLSPSLSSLYRSIAAYDLCLCSRFFFLETFITISVPCTEYCIFRYTCYICLPWNCECTLRKIVRLQYHSPFDRTCLNFITMFMPITLTANVKSKTDTLTNKKLTITKRMQFFKECVSPKQYSIYFVIDVGLMTCPYPFNIQHLVYNEL